VNQTKTSKHNIFSSFGMPRMKCKLTRSCNLYSPSSYTRTHVGGTYCGKYRLLAAIEEDKFAAEEEAKENYLV